MNAKAYVLVGVFAILALAAGAVPLDAVQLPWEGRTPFKTAIIKYKLTGPNTDKVTAKGESTVYIRDYGRERVRISKLSMKGEEGAWFPMDSVTIITAEEVIEVRTELDESGKVHRTGKKWTNPVNFYRASYKKLKGKDLENYHKSLRENGTIMDFNGMLFNPEQRNAKMVLGYQTDLLNLMGNKFYYISGTPIALTGNTFLMNFNATGIDKNVGIPNRVFQPPAGVKVEFDPEREKSNRDYAEMNIEKLGTMITSLKGLENLFGERQQKSKERQARQEEQATEKAARDKEEKDDDKAAEEEDYLEKKMMKGLKSLKSLFN